MTEEEFEQIRDKDHVVLQHIKEGQDDVQKITAETTLENHHVSYCFEKLEQQGLITVDKPDRMVERVVDGQKRVFQHPKKAELTEKGEEYLENAEQEATEMYEDMSHREVVNKLHDLEDEVARLQDAFEAFRKQVQQKIR
jgi:predicted transcriptional regulator